MPLREWPSADRELWLAAIRQEDLLEGGGARSGLRPTSNRKMERGYGRFLTFMNLAGLCTENIPAVDQISEPVVRRYVRELRELGNSTGTLLGRLQELHDVVRSMRPDRDWSWIRGVASRIRSNHLPSIKKRHRMVATDDLLRLGQQLMQAAPRKKSLKGSALEYRDGLLLALLALRPLRLRNLAALDLDRTLLRERDAFRISFDGNETKNGSPLSFPWPDVLLEPLIEWLEGYRPELARQTNRWTRRIGGALWVSSHGSPMTKQAIYDRVAKRTAQAFGAAINPHLFRDIAATTQAIEDPKHIRITAALLGHKTFATTERFYLQGRMLESTGRYQDGLLALRSDLRRAKP